MKKIYLSLMLTLGVLVSFGQSTGDIAFVSFNVDTDEDFAIVALADIPENTIVYFTDNEPNGSTISTGEGTFSWNTGTAVISAGTVITFNDVASSTDLTATIGTLTDGAGTFALSQNGDGIVAYLGTEGNPTTFLAGIQNEEGNEGSLDGSGLSLGSTFITISPDPSSSPDGGNYTGSRNSQATFSGYINLIADFANWTTVASSGEDAFPFNTTSFTLSSSMTVGFDDLTSQVNETNANFQTSIPVSLANYAGNPVNLSVAVTGGSATTADYILTTTTLSYTSDGTMTLSIDIVPDADDISETVEITLSETTSTGILLSPMTHTLTINDDDTAPLIITEIMYNPATALGSDTNYEYIEIYNAGTSTVDLNGYTLTSAFESSFTSGDQITAGEYILVTIDAASYTATGGQVFQWTSGSLQNGGEAIVLKNPSGATVDEVTYNPSIIEAANGDGPSLSLFDLTADNNDMTYWIGSGTTNGTPGTANNDITVWTSTSSTDASIAANWSNGLPTSGVSAAILSSGLNLSVSADLSTASLKIGSGVTLGVSAGTLNVTNELILDGSATTASGASLAIFGANSGSGMLTVSRNTTGNGGYSILGAPVSNVNLADISANYLYAYDEATSSFVTAAGTTMGAGVGFFVGYDAVSPSVSFTGSPTSGTVTHALTANDAGFNLIANPYAAAISINTFLASNSTDTDGTVYLWDDGGTNEGSVRGGDYVTVNNVGTVGAVDLAGTGQTGNGPASNGFIASTQGFFVKANTAGIATFNPAMQVTTPDANLDGNHYREAKEKQLIRFSISGNGLYNETLLGFLDKASLQKDKGLDALKFSGNDLISFYSFQGDEKYAIQALPKLNTEVSSIMLGMDLAEPAEYVLHLSEVSGIADNKSILIIDHETGKVQDIRDNNTLTFSTSSALVNAKRFEVVISDATILDFEKLNMQNEVAIFSSEGMLNIRTDVALNNASINIYSINGTELMSVSNVNLNKEIWSVNFSWSGVFIMTIQTADRAISKKFINN